MRRSFVFVVLVLTLVSPSFAQNVTGSNGDLYVNTPPSPYASGVLLQSNSTTPDVSVRLGGTSSSADFGIFDSAGNAHMKVLGDGRVLIGKDASANPAYHLQLKSSMDSAAAMISWSNTTVEAAATQNDLGAWLLSYQNVAAGITNGGTATGARMRGWLNGPGNLNATYGAYVQSGLYPSAAVTGTVGSAYGVFIDVSSASGAIDNGYGLYIKDVLASNGRGIHQAGINDTNYFGGNVGIGTSSPTVKLDVVGDLKVSGTITGGTVIGAVYQDVAEWVPATTDLAPGTVVVLNPEKNNEVMASHGAYDTTVAGVVSAQPGVILGVAGEGKEQIATTGRVKVRVDARSGAIRVGDLLVTGEIEGTAMKSDPMQINGRRFHQPGTIIGKALEPLESGVGEILVLLSLQ